MTTASYAVVEQAMGVYSYQVSACNASGCSQWSDPYQVEVVIAPATPTLTLEGAALNADGKSYGVTARWTNLAAIQYQLRRSGPDSSVVVVTPFDSSTRVKTEVLTTSGDYRWEVRGCVYASGGSPACSDWSVPRMIRVLLWPEKPVLKNAISGTSTDGRIYLEWHAAKDASQYEIVTTFIPEDGEESQSSTSLISATTYERTGLADGQYSFTITAVNAAGRSQPLAIGPVVVNVPKPPSLELSWKADSVAIGRTAVLQWQATDANSCKEVSAGDADVALSGERETVYSTAGTVTVTFECQGDLGTVRKSAVLTVASGITSGLLPVEVAPRALSTFVDGNRPVGTLPASEQVLPSGAYVYSIPIVTTGAVNGLVPELALVYDSQRMSGAMGRGWSISGYSVIQRCGQDRERDGVARAISFDQNDRFCLDGQRLVTDGSYGGVNATYDTEISGGVKIQSIGGGQGNPSTFELRRGDGSIVTYGLEGDRIDGIINSATFAWPISRIEDVNGNRIDFEYLRVANSLEFHLQRVRYTNHKNTAAAFKSEIKFNYVNGAPEPRYGYLHGDAVSLSKRLVSVESRSDNVQLKSYRLSYDNSNRYLESVTACRDSHCLPPTRFTWINGQNDVPSFAARQSFKLTKDRKFMGFQPADTDGDGQIDILMLANDSSDSSDHLVIGRQRDGIFYQRNQASEIATDSFKKSWRVIDINGDDADDLVWAQLYFLEATEEEDFPTEARILYRVAAGGEYAYSTTVDTGIVVDKVNLFSMVDFNADGEVDIISVNKKSLYVSYGDGTGSFGSPQPLMINLVRKLGSSYPKHGYDVGLLKDFHAAVQLDFNGDGRPDFLTKVREHSCEAPESPQVGDELDIVKCEVGSWTWRLIVAGEGGFTEIGHWPDSGEADVRVLDINQDGNGDIVYRRDGAGWFYRLGDGRGLTQELPFFSGFTIPSSEFAGGDSATHFADINGDGQLDFIGLRSFGSEIDSCIRELQPDYSGSAYTCYQKYPAEWHVAYFSIMGFNAPEPLAAGTTDNERSMFVDIDADGFADYVAMDGDVGWQLRTNAPYARIAAVVDGYGNRSEIDYRALSDATVYTKGNAQLLDTSNWGNGSKVFDAIQPMYVVAAFKRPGTLTAYQYGGLRYQLGRGSLGFESFVSHDLLRGVASQTHYAQGWPYTGQMTKSSSHFTGATGEATWECGDGADMVDRYARCLTLSVNPASIDVASGTTLSTTELAFDRRSGVLVTRAIVPYVRLSQTETYDVDGNWLTSSTQEQSDLDGFGNARIASSTTTDHTVSGDNEWTESVTRDFDYSYQGFARLLSEETITSYGDSEARNQTTWTYDAKGLLATETSRAHLPELKAVRRIAARDLYGNPTRVETVVAGVTTLERFAYTGSGRYVSTVTNPLNHVQTTTYGANFNLAIGAPSAVADANGGQVSYSYTTMGRKYKETTNSGSEGLVSQYWCDGAGGCPDGAVYIEVTEGRGLPTTKSYVDGQGRVLRTESEGLDAGDWSVVDTEYTARGEVKRQSQPYEGGGVATAWTEYQYDDFGRVEQVTKPDDGEWLYEYERLSITTINPAGSRRTEVKDAAGKIRQVIDDPFDGGSVIANYRYDAFGNPTEIDGPDGVTTRVEYDDAGRRKRVVDADKGAISYSVDAWDREYLSHHEGRNVRGRTEFDNVGRVIRERHYNGAETAANLQTQVDYVYDTAVNGKGQLHRRTLTNYLLGAQTFVDERSYDGFGRATGQTISLSNGRRYLLSTTYDAAGRVRDVTDASGKTVRRYYSQTGLHRATGDLSHNLTLWQVSEMDAMGHATRTTFGNGVTTIAGYNSVGLVTGLYSSVQDSRYQWDQLGNLEHRDERHKGLFETFTYDGMNRLRTSQISGMAEQEVRYADNGNITFKSGVGSYSYNSVRPHAVTKVTSASGAVTNYSYDAAGNMTTDGKRSLSYTTTEVPYRVVSGGTTTEFTYGFDGGRFKRVDSKEGVTTTTWTVGNVEIISSTERSGETVKRYLDGVAIATYYPGGGSDIHYQHKDHLGSLDLMTDERGRVVERFSFDPWGARRNADWHKLGSIESMLQQRTMAALASDLTTRGFTGHEHLDDAGLIHMNGRVYDPVLARFLSADPLIQDPFNPQSLNRYSYVFNNPLNATDPSGYNALGLVTTIVNIAAMFFQVLYPVAVALNCYTAAVTALQLYDAYHQVGGSLVLENSWVTVVQTAYSLVSSFYALGTMKTDGVATSAGETAIAGTADSAEYAAEAFALDPDGQRFLDKLSAENRAFSLEIKMAAHFDSNPVMLGTRYTPSGWVDYWSNNFVSEPYMEVGLTSTDALFFEYSPFGGGPSAAARAGMGAAKYGAKAIAWGKARWGRVFGANVVDKFSRAPKSLMDQMVLEAAKQGKGVKIIDSLNDPKFKGMEKWSYSELSANGLRSEVHYVRNPKTGELMDFKLKHHADIGR